MRRLIQDNIVSNSLIVHGDQLQTGMNDYSKGPDAEHSRVDCIDFFSEIRKQALKVRGWHVIFEQLYSSEDNSDLFNRWGLAVFRTLETTVTEVIINKLSSLTDSAFFGKNERLSIKRLRQKLCNLDKRERPKEAFFKKLDELIDDFNDCVKPTIRRFRNIHTAHLDAEYTLDHKVVRLQYQEIWKALERLYKLLNHVQDELQGGATDYDFPFPFHAGTDGRQMLKALRLADKTERQKL